MKQIEIEKEIKKGDFYIHPESSTGSNGQVNNARQNNFLMYFLNELNQNISKLDKDINKFRTDIGKYNTSNKKSTKWIIGLTIFMGLVASIQIVLSLNQYFRWF